MSSQSTKKLKLYYQLTVINFIIYIFPLVAFVESLWKISTSIYKTIKVNIKSQWIGQRREFNRLRTVRSEITKEIWQ